MLPMLLIGQAKVFKHGKAKTLYVSIPSKVAQDSAFTIREGDTVEVEYKKDLDAVVIKKKPAKRTPPE
jgi:Antidote-toxin recognition MazE, bacterial antitoxin